MASKLDRNGYATLRLSNEAEAVFARNQGFPNARKGSLIPFLSEESCREFLKRLKEATKRPKSEKRRRTPPNQDNGLPIVL